MLSFQASLPFPTLRGGAALERSIGRLDARRSEVVLEGTHRMDPDRAIVERALAGDEAAFRELFVRHREDTARLVHRMVGPSPEVEDIVQEVFLHVYRSLASFRGDARFSTWLYRLTVNVTRMHLRRRRSRPRFADVEVPEAGPASEPRPLDPSEHAEQRARVLALYRLIDAISEKKREVLVLHDLEGTPAREIAELLSIPVLTVRTRLFYARKELYSAMLEDPTLRSIVRVVGERLPNAPPEAIGRSGLGDDEENG